MPTDRDRQFGAVVTRVIRGENLTRDEARDAFQVVLDDATSEMQQGRFWLLFRPRARPRRRWSVPGRRSIPPTQRRSLRESLRPTAQEKIDE